MSRVAPMAGVARDADGHVVEDVDPVVPVVPAIANGLSVTA